MILKNLPVFDCYLSYCIYLLNFFENKKMTKILQQFCSKLNMLFSFYQAKFTSSKYLSLAVTLYRNKNFFPKSYDLLMPSNFHLLLKLQVLVFAYKETLIVSIFFCPPPTPLPHSISTGQLQWVSNFIQACLANCYLYTSIVYYHFMIFVYFYIHVYKGLFLI